MTALRRHEPLERRTYQPVRRDSRPADAPWERQWRNRMSRRELDRMLLAARIFDRRGRRRGLNRRNGQLGHIALELLEALANIAHRRKGWVFPTIDSLASMLDRSTSAICRALDALRDHGFLSSARRFVRVDGEAGRRGPQVKQTSNLYRLELPAWAEKLLGLAQRAPPPPDDARQDQAARAAALRAYADAEEAERRDTAAGRIAAAAQEGSARAQTFNARRNAIPPTNGNPPCKR